MGLLSALAAGGALAAERLHFTHFITRDGATLKDGDKVFRFADPRAGTTALKTTPAALQADPRLGTATLNGQRPRSSKTGSRRWCKPGRKPSASTCCRQQEFDKACGRETYILAPETADGMPRLNESHAGV